MESRLSPPSHSPWKTLRVSHRLTVPTTGDSGLTSYRGTHAHERGTHDNGAMVNVAPMQPLPQINKCVSVYVAPMCGTHA